MGKLFTIDTQLPNSPFGAKSTAEEVTEGIDLNGKVALVTGCNSGLGYETMRVLALRGAHVIGTGRTLEKAREACKNVKGKTTPLAMELSNFSSIVECATKVQEMGLPIDILICNAGTSTFGEQQFYYGIEEMFVINYLSHFILVNRLLPLVHSAKNARIVHVGSRASHSIAPPSGIDFDNLRGEKKAGGGLERYAQSKLANTLFSFQLSKKLAGTGTTSNVVHPGLVRTSIVRHTPGIFRMLFNSLGILVAKNLAQGAATQTYLAAHPLVEGLSGAYFQDCNPVIIGGKHHLYDEPLAEKLWEVSESMTRDYLI